MGNNVSMRPLTPEQVRDETQEFATTSMMDFLKRSVVHAGHFAVLKALLRMGMLSCSKTYKALPAGERTSVDLYVLSLYHAFVTTGFAAYKLLFCDPNKLSAFNYRSLSFNNGYFIHDFIASASRWLQHPLDILHHVCAISLISGGVYQQLSPTIVPHFLVVEGSTVFLCIMWLLRRFGRETSKMYMASSLLFALSFFVLRILWLPYALYGLFKYRVGEKNINVLKAIFAPVMALQFFWFKQIMKQLMSKLRAV
eukprot:GILJ01007786.1.p1 GENE.GILJ01007786.1~~GILJ01007786.1.p1  ORF type:complete len:254 (-),score=38.35 GILJ01007786.1:49-810(-)